jgi:hypothetical protein
MPKRLKVDPVKLVAAVESGTPSTKIMKQFNIKTIGQLKSLYVDALAEQGKIQGIKTSRRGRTPSAKPPAQGLVIGKRGSLILPREIIEEMGFKIGDTFSVRKSAAGVSLRKIEPDQESS